MKRFLPLIIFLLAVTAGCRQTAPPAFSKRLLLYSNVPLKEGSFEECVALMIAGGMPVREALQQCGQLKSPPGAEGVQIGGVQIDLGPSARGTNDLVPKVSSCSGPPSGIITPSLDTGYGPNYGDKTQRPLTSAEQKEAVKELKEDLDKAKMAEAAAEQAEMEAAAEFEKAAVKWSKAPAGTPEKDQAKKVFDEVWGKYKEAIMYQDRIEVNREQIEYLIEHPEQIYTSPMVATPVAGAVTKCQEVADFLDQCNSQNWRGSDCESFLAALGKCADPRLIRTNGEESACGMPAVSAAEAEHALLIACDAGRRRPVPGEDPCQVVIDGVRIRQFYTPNGFRPPQPGCNDPQSLVEPEACVGTGRVVEFGIPDLQKIAEFGKQKLGGPLILITTRNPDPNPRPGPEPRPGP